MISSRELLAAARSAQGIPSNYRLARVLDVPEQSVQRWNTGKNTPDDPMAVRLAEMAGLDPAMVLASMYVQRTQGGPMNPVWTVIAQRLQAAAALAFAAIVSVLAMVMPDGGAQAATRAGAGSAYSASGVDQAIHCRAFAALRRLARRLLRRLAPHPLMGACVSA